MTEPCDLSAVDARARIGRKQLSPVELLESCIARIEAVDAAVNAMVARDYEGARRTARNAEAAVMAGDDLPPLHGLPVGVKDLSSTARLRTTWGSPIFRDHVPERDDNMVRDIRSAGGIILGKTNTPEWGAGANTRNAVYGATVNPFDPQKSAARSSGGSAVALATGMVPLCTGSDTGGSLRNPAAFYGIVGFRPSPGLVPSETRMHGWTNLAALGPMARTVPDLCLLLSSMVSDDASDPLATSIFGREIGARRISIRSCRLTSPRFVRRLRPTSDLRRPSTRSPKSLLKRPAYSAKSLRKPKTQHPTAPARTKPLPSFGRWDSSPRISSVFARAPTTRPNVRKDVEAGLRFTATDVARAEALRTQLYRRWQNFFASHDIIVTPTITISPRP